MHDNMYLADNSCFLKVSKYFQKSIILIQSNVSNLFDELDTTGDTFLGTNAIIGLDCRCFMSTLMIKTVMPNMHHIRSILDGFRCPYMAILRMLMVISIELRLVVYSVMYSCVENKQWFLVDIC